MSYDYTYDIEITFLYFSIGKFFAGYWKLMILTGWGAFSVTLDTNVNATIKAMIICSYK